MKTVIITLIMAMLLISGCQRGDIKAQIVIQGQPAPYDGYNISPEIYVLEGQPVPMTGALVWINGLDPNFMGD